MSETLEEVVEERGIGRLCHLTPSRNLVHIASGNGLRSTKQLSEMERAEFTQQDLQRLDGHPDHISCSIEYPNAWYLRQKRGKGAEGKLFTDWVALGIHPKHILGSETLFCPHNAGGAGGESLEPGVDTFRGLYDAEVRDHRGRPFLRSERFLRASPTNDQAEVMVRRAIQLADIRAIFVPDEAQARRELIRLERVAAGAMTSAIVIAPDFFNPFSLRRRIESGRAPEETPFTLEAPVA